MRSIYILHTGENRLENLPEAFEDEWPDHNPKRLDHPYKYMAGNYSNIPTIWWASDCEVVPQVGWYVDVPNDPVECSDWGLGVRVVRVKLCRDYCRDGAPISHVEITCRVVYEGR